MNKKTVSKRKKIIPNRLFHVLWLEAEKINNQKEYIKTFTSASSAKYVDFRSKYDLEYDEAVTLLGEIYKKQHLTFKEILNLANKRKADISNTFCIPVRTVEEWYSGKNKCSAYIRLMIMRHYHLINLGKYIYAEFEEEYQNTKPSVYHKSEDSTGKKEKQKVARDSTHENNQRELEQIIKEYEERKTKEQKNAEVKKLLEKTDYITSIIKK